MALSYRGMSSIGTRNKFWLVDLVTMNIEYAQARDSVRDFEK